MSTAIDPHTVDRPGRRSRSWLAAGVGVVLVALAVLALVQVLAIAGHHDHDDGFAALQKRRAAAVTAASSEVSTLLTVSAASSTTDIKALLAGATATFRDELEKQASAFQQALKAGKVTSTGSVVAAGLVSLKGDAATVAIAAKQTIKNASAPTGSARSYRLTVTVTDVSGTWLTSSLNFVV